MPWFCNSSNRLWIVLCNSNALACPCADFFLLSWAQNRRRPDILSWDFASLFSAVVSTHTFLLRAFL